LSDTITFLTDPIGNANPIAGVHISRFCFNVTEWAAQRAEFKEVALQLGWICLVVGFAIGAVSVYFYMRSKYADTD